MIDSVSAYGLLLWLRVGQSSRALDLLGWIALISLVFRLMADVSGDVHIHIAAVVFGKK